MWGCFRQFTHEGSRLYKMYVCFRLRAKGKHKLTVRITGPGGLAEGMAAQDGLVELPDEEVMIDQAVCFPNLVLSKEGEYTVVLLEDDQELASTIFEAEKLDGEKTT